MVWNTTPRQAHHESRNLIDAVYVPVLWLQDSGRRQFALIGFSFLSWGSFPNPACRGKGLLYGSKSPWLRYGSKFCQPSRNRHIRASFSAFPRFDRTEKKGRKAKLMYA